MTFANSHVWSLRFIYASALAYAPRRGGATGGAARAGRASSGAFGARRSARDRAVGGERRVEIRDWIVHELAVSILRPRRTVARMILFRAMRRRDHNLYQAHEARLGNLYSALLVRPLRRRTRPTFFLQLEAFVLRTGQHLSAIMVFTRWLEHHSLVKARRDHALVRPSLGGKRSPLT